MFLDGWNCGEENINGECKNCGIETVDGEAYKGCFWSRIECELCRSRPCDESC